MKKAPKRKPSKLKRAVKPSAKEVSRLHKKLWKLFSAYIRARDNGVCFTCGSIWSNWHDTDAGHFISRRIKSTLYDPRNVHCQCRKCNRFLYGNVAEYSERLISRYGLEVFNELMAISRKIKQWNAIELKLLIESFKTGTFDKEYAAIRDKIK